MCILTVMEEAMHFFFLQRKKYVPHTCYEDARTVVPNTKVSAVKLQDVCSRTSNKCPLLLRV